MRKSLLSTSALVAVFSLFSLNVWADEVVNGIKYQIWNGEAVVYGLDDESITDLVIPATVEINGETYQVTEVTDMAFQNKTFKSITFSEGLKKIQSYVFSNCKNVEKPITLPSTLEYLGTEPFASLTSCPEFIVAEENEYFQSVDGAVYTKDLSTLLIAPAGKTGEMKVPEGTKNIKSGSCRNISITSLTLPSTLTNIDKSAFYGANSLKEIKAYFENPFELERLAFGGVNHASVKLHVLKGLKDKFADQSTAGYWAYFDIVDDLDPTTGVADIASDASVQVMSNGVAVSANAWAVYSVTGVKVASGYGDATVVLKKGLYIVKADGVSRKVYIK